MAKGLLLIVVVVLAVAAALAYTGGEFSPDRLTPDRFLAQFKAGAPPQPRQGPLLPR